ncbi:MAG: dethiobiotin synthase [Chitinophagaceae bacterium]|nr:MAG: dethiobiotin synthase [Chitinophagaceae bacterium]
MAIFFITGIGTGIGKTLISAIVAEALGADYWKPVQAGDTGETDSEWVKNHIHNGHARVHPELYKLQKAASPHIAAKEEGIQISVEKICKSVPEIKRNLIVEGAGGLMVPLNNKEFIADLIQPLGAKVILVSRNYLGSINHSLLTAHLLKQKNLPVLGWIFNDQYLDYENEIANWTNIPRLGSVPFTANANSEFVARQATILKERLENILW